MAPADETGSTAWQSWFATPAFARQPLAPAFTPTPPPAARAGFPAPRSHRVAFQHLALAQRTLPWPAMQSLPQAGASKAPVWSPARSTHSAGLSKAAVPWPDGPGAACWCRLPASLATGQWLQAGPAPAGSSAFL